MITKSIQYAIWCDSCDNYEDYSEKHKPSTFKKMGWVEDDDGNWACPECVRHKK